MTIGEILNRSIDELREASVSEPGSSAKVLLGNVLNMNKTELLTNQNKKVLKAKQEKYQKYIERRKKHESVWHIIGWVPFWGLDFLVNENVLVPRPETELLVEKVVNHILGLSKTYCPKPIALLDVGTGSGTIAVTLANEFPEMRITASEISKKALIIAKKNAKHNATPNVKFIQSDLFSNIEEKFDIIVANLPYIPEEEMESLAIDVYHYEPRIALSGGRGGLEIYKKFLKDVGGHINPGGIIFCEIGKNQGKEFVARANILLPGSKYEIIKDFAEIDRIVIISTSNKLESRTF